MPVAKRTDRYWLGEFHVLGSPTAVSSLEVVKSATFWPGGNLTEIATNAARQEGL